MVDGVGIVEEKELSCRGAGIAHGRRAERHVGQWHYFADGRLCGAGRGGRVAAALS